MQENFGVNIIFNVKDGTLKNANANVTNLNKQVSLTQTSVRSLNATFENTFFALGSLNLAFGAIGASLGATLKSSLDLTSANEQLKNSLASLIALNHSFINAQGKSLDANTKWNASLALGEETIKRLNLINLKTIYTMQDMAEMFKSFYSTAGSNMSLEEAISAMEAIAYAGQISGASVDSLKMTLDSLGAGVAQTQTDFGRFISALGLSTEAMSQAKSEGKLYALIIEKLGGFSKDASRSANTYEAAVSNLSNALDELKKKAIAPYFEGIKNAINATSEAISKNEEAILTTLGVLTSFGGSIALVWGATKSLNLAFSIVAPLKAYALALRGIEFSANGAKMALGGVISLLKRFAPTASIFALVEAYRALSNHAQKAYEMMQKMSQEELLKTLKTKQEELKKLEEGSYFDRFGREAKALRDYHKGEKKIALQKEIAELMLQIKELESQKGRGELTLMQKDKKNSPGAIKDVSLAYEQMAKVGLREYDLALLEIGNQTQKWVDAGVRLNDALATQNLLMQDLESKQALKEMNAELDLRTEEIALGNDSLTQSIELEKIRYEKALASLNARVAKEVELGEMSLSYSKRLYALEEKKHQKALEDIEEEHRIRSGFGEYFSQSLNENFINVLDGGKLENFGKNLQKSASQALGRSLAKSFEDSRALKAMDQAFDTAISGASEGLGQALNSLFGENFINQFSDALGGVLAGIGLGDAISSSLASLMPEQNAKGAQALGKIGSGIGTGIGAIVGSVVPGLGTMLGGVIGGSAGGLLGNLIGGFYGKKTEITSEGLELTKEGNKNAISAREYVDFEEEKSYLWGLQKSYKSWSEYSQASSYATLGVKNILRGLENAMSDLSGLPQELTLKAGRYKDYHSLIESVSMQVIEGVLGEENKSQATGLHKMWSDYAKSVDKGVSEAILEGMNSFLKSGQTYTKWLYDFKGDTLGSAQYSAELAQKEVDRLQEALGVSGIHIDNFLSFREERIKKAFDPNTIALINSLGEALSRSAEASKKFEEALKKESKTKLKALDPFLKNTKTLEEAKAFKGELESKTNLKILSTLQKILKAQEMVSYGGAL